MIPDLSPLFEALAANPVLAGGIGTVLFGAVLYVARELPQFLWRWLCRALSVELTVTTRNHQFDEITRLLNAHRLAFLMRNFAPSHEVGKAVPGYGLGWARYNGVLIVFQRKRLESKLQLEEEIELRFLTRDVRVIERFLVDADDFRDPGKIRMYASDGAYFATLPQKLKRSLDTVFIPQAAKDALRDRFAWFMGNERWYLDRGIPYKLCALLYGPPGTGKTSLVHALASEFDLRINYVTSLAQVDTLMRHCNEKDLVVIEDIDALSDDLAREQAPAEPQTITTDEGYIVPVGDLAPPTIKMPDAAKVLHKLLNAMDGFATPHGLKVILTTNHPDKLDPAIKRPGRTDLLLEIGYLGAGEIAAMVERFYGAGAADPIRRHVDRGGVVAERSGSSLQEIFTRHTLEEAISLILAEPEADTITGEAA